jgi:hypothetical protein
VLFLLLCVCVTARGKCFLFTAGTYKVKVKVRFTLQQATKAQRGSRDIALLFL